MRSRQGHSQESGRDTLGEGMNPQHIVAHLRTCLLLAHRNGRMVDVTMLRRKPLSYRTERHRSFLSLAKIACPADIPNRNFNKLMDLGIEFYYGMKDVRKIEELANSGNKDADLALRALTYQIAKEIGALSTVFNGKLDCIAITGGLAHSDRIVKDIVSRVEFLSRVLIFPGEDEMASLALGVLRVLRGEEEPKKYKGTCKIEKPA